MLESTTKLAEDTAASKKIYTDFIQSHSSSTNLFGADSYGFANKIHQLQIDTIHEMIRLVDNRLYGELYKLRRVILAFTSDHVPERVTQVSENSSIYTKYKDIVDSSTTYPFDTTALIFADIVSLVHILDTLCEERSSVLADGEKSTARGMNVHHLVASCRYETNILSEKIVLYRGYIDTFITYHSKYVERISEKVKALETQIQDDLISDAADAADDTE
jgi:hypothetical protein